VVVVILGWVGCVVSGFMCVVWFQSAKSAKTNIMKGVSPNAVNLTNVNQKDIREVNLQLF
jgi:ribosomal protein L24E